MNYRHSYHVGNFADVFKHVTLIALLNKIKQKPAAFCYLDTHAARGIYDLSDPLTQKTKEYELGISKIFNAAYSPELIQQYIHCIKTINQTYANDQQNALRFYPGSPLIAKTQLRAQDRLIACELEASEYALLKELFHHDKLVAIHHNNGLHGLKAILPPQEKRGLILMDSPFENKNEFVILLDAFKLALQRFANGVCAIWYPIKDLNSVETFKKKLSQIKGHDILIIELSIYPEATNTLSGSGIAIINPPYCFIDDFSQSLTWLWKTLTINNLGKTTLQFLK